MTDAIEPGAAAPDRRLTAMHAIVDIGFCVLLVVCAARYFSYHPFTGYGVAVMALAAAAGLAYAVSAIRPLDHSRQRIGILLATGLWLPLVVMAPSFGWCAFALFFAVHRVLAPRIATVASGLIVVSVSAGLLIMSNGEDLGLVLGPFFGGLVLSFAYGVLDQALENRRRLIDELVETREQLATSEREAGALAERERVASELHDTVVQRTASALLLLESDELSAESTAGAQAPTAVVSAREVLREALVETRQLMHGLAAGRSAAQSLVPALGEIAHEHGADFSVVGDIVEPDDEVSHALRRVTQEALTNVGKHASATAARVTLTFFEGAIGVDIADNGVGFDPATLGSAGGADGGSADGAADRVDAGSPARSGAGSAAGEYGLRAMTWRMESLGGSFTLESAPGSGTVVVGVVPVDTAGSVEAVGAGHPVGSDRAIRTQIDGAEGTIPRSAR